METPSQDLIACRTCGQIAKPHTKQRLHCVDCARSRSTEYARQFRERQKAKPRIVVCKGCGEQFDASRNGRTWRCAECTRKYLVEHREKNRQWHADYSRSYRKRLGDEYNNRQVQRRKDIIASLSPEELVEFRRKESKKSQRLYAVIRDEVFDAYGGAVCACCGESERSFLSVDHINNDGAEQRRRGDYGRSGTSFYQWLRKNNFPDGYQVLCMNCNMGKHRNGGVCPHQSSKV